MPKVNISWSLSLSGNWNPFTEFSSHKSHSTTAPLHPYPLTHLLNILESSRNSRPIIVPLYFRSRWLQNHRFLLSVQFFAVPCRRYQFNLRNFLFLPLTSLKLYIVCLPTEFCFLYFIILSLKYYYSEKVKNWRCKFSWLNRGKLKNCITSF